MSEQIFLTAEQIDSNYQTFRSKINTLFPSRKDALNQMYDSLEESLMLSPASSYAHFHNAFPGGYTDHVLRVADFAKKHYDLWVSEGMDMDFTEEELMFAAFHHDLGKLGLPDKTHYIVNDSAWHRKEQGKMYNRNTSLPWMDVTDQGFYLFNHFGIKYSLNEMLGIKLTDGMYTDSNKPYYSGFNLETKLRSNLPYILHHADLMAFRFEFTRWAKVTGKFKLGISEYQPVRNNEIKKIRANDDMDTFNKLFEI